MFKKWYVISFLWQCIIFAILTVVICSVYDVKSGISTFFGGLAYCFPVVLVNLYIHSGSDTSDGLARAYSGSVYRLMMAAGMLVFLFRETDLIPSFLIGMFCLASVVQYVTSFIFINREK